MLDRFIIIFNYKCAYPAWVMICHRVFRNFCCKSLKFSKKENQEKLQINKQRETKQTRAFFIISFAWES